MNPPLTDIVASGHSTSSAPVPDGCVQLFAPCLDPECQRPCGAHRPYSARAIEITEKMHATKRQASFWEIFGLLVATGIAVSMCVGVVLKGAENTHQTQIANSEP